MAETAGERSVPLGLLRRALVMLVLVLAGCGGRGISSLKLVPVKGTVQYNGQPLAHADVVFLPEGGTPATGTTGPDGRFELTTGGRRGAIPGNHRVTVVAHLGGADREDYTKMTDEDLARISNDPAAYQKMLDSAASGIPAKYGNPDQSGLKATVSEHPDENDFFFDLKG